MKIVYDKQADALSISLREGLVSETIEVAPEIMLDIDSDRNLIHLEIIGAEEKLSKNKEGGSELTLVDILTNKNLALA